MAELMGFIHACAPQTQHLLHAATHQPFSIRVTSSAKRAWTQIKDDVDETGIDRLELLAWSIQILMAAAGQAKQQKNPRAVVACIKQLDWMTGLGINSTAAPSGRRGYR